MTIGVRLIVSTLAMAALAVSMFAAGLEVATDLAGHTALVFTAGLVLVAGLAAAIIWGMRAHVLGPVKRIHDFAVKVAGGEYGQTMLEHFQAELEETARAIRTMKENLVDSLGFSQGVLNGIKTPFIVVNDKEILVLTNQALLEILQYESPPEQYYGQNVAFFFYQDAKRKTVLSDAMAQNTSITKEVITVGKKGAKRNIIIAASPLFNPINSKLMGALCIYSDVTELRAREAEIQGQNESLAKAAKDSEAICGDVSERVDSLSQRLGLVGEGAKRQEDRLQATSAAVEQIDASVRHVAENAKAVVKASEDAVAKAKDGESTVAKLAAAIDQVQTMAQGLREAMGVLGQQAQSIGMVMTVINDIADQTNLLALNAAIEAARAGEAGRGFAVVADEVRKLAEKTMNATNEVDAAILAIQTSAKLNVEKVDSAVNAVAQTTAMAQDSGQALRDIVRLVSDTTLQIHAIAHGANEQSQAVRQMTEAVGDIHNVASQTVEGMEESRQGVESLSKLFYCLRGIIDGMAC